MRRLSAVPRLLVALTLGTLLSAAVRDPDFTGQWVLDRTASKMAALDRVEPALTIAHTDKRIQAAAGSTQWSYPLDGSETRKRAGAETQDSSTKWEGAALLINTVVSGPQNYSVMERWVLSRDRNTLTVTRQVVKRAGESEGVLVYRREGTTVAPAATAPPAAPAVPAGSQPSLVKRTEPPAAPADALSPDITVNSGTRVLLALVNEISTKRAKDGDHVYLRTDAPVAVTGRVVIPRGSDVSGTVTHTKPAGKVKGKGELYIRFDSIVLPNGVARDFLARPSGDEGKVDSDGKSADARTVMAGAGMGATIGGITRGLGGAGVGAGVGALAGVLLSRNQDVILKPGTHIEMVLDRDLVFRSDELERIR